MSEPRRFVVDGTPVPFEDGESIALAIRRAGQHPREGGTLCMTGDCPSCVASVDGVAWVRTCQTPARAGLVVRRHPAVGAPPLPESAQAAPLSPLPFRAVAVEHVHADVAVIGAGDSGTAVAAESRAAGHDVVVLDASNGDEVVAIYPGPLVIVRTATGMRHVHAHEVVVATGSAELHPVCPGDQLAGLLTPRAAALLLGAGVELGAVVCVGPAAVPDAFEPFRVPGTLVRLEGDGAVAAVVFDDGGTERRHPADTVVFALGTAPRDVLARMSGDPAVRTVGGAARRHDLPPCPTEGTVCPCSRVTVEDLDGVWSRGFHDLELMKRASLCGTGTCQGSVCVPHLRAFVADRSGQVPEPFTARPASRQITLGEAAANVFTDVFRRTALHDVHVALGARMDRFGGWWRPWNYGDHVTEYWAVREAVSLGDVSTLGKMVVSGPDVVEALERLYPNHVADIRPGRSRYALVLDERGHVMDDGMILRESDTRFVLTFTSGGAANAEMWVRDWVDAWGLDVHVLDRTASLGAINVTGPLAGELLQRCGLAEPPRFLQHVHAPVAGVPCHVMRLSFTGEASFELHHPVDRSVELWQALWAAGGDLGVRPHGLQALFGLRLEKGHVIVGMDSELDSTPRRLGMEWAIRMEKPAFIGREALARIEPLPDDRRLVGLTLDGPAPIEGSPIRSEGGDLIGHVTSSFASPTFGYTVMLGLLRRRPFPERVVVDDRIATVTPTPFYDPEGRRARA